MNYKLSSQGKHYPLSEDFLSWDKTMKKSSHFLCGASHTLIYTVVHQRDKMGDEGAPVGREYKGAVNASIVRSYEEELKFIRQVAPCKFEIAKGFVPGMNVGGTFYVNNALEGLLMDELKASCGTAGYGGFLPAVKQIANVAALPGIVKR
jgi:hypothetical protein